MKTQEISALLDKYYRGETTEEEEMFLRNHFSQSSDTDEFGDEKEIFNFYASEQDVPLPSPGFENRIIAAIDGQEKLREKRHRRRLIYSAISTAAALIIIIGSYFYFAQQSNQTDTYSDPAVAYAETMKILMTVSATLNKGQNALEPVGRLAKMNELTLDQISKSSLMIQSTARKLDILQKVSGNDSTGMDEKNNN